MISRARRVVGVVAGVVVGGLAGLGGFTFVYARGASYLSDRAEVCANCHVMQEQYEAWGQSSHHAVAVCNDCHTPSRLVGKYATKVENGYHHSLAFTTGRFHEPIQIKGRNLAVTEGACRRCHEPMVQAIDTFHGPGEALSCVRCHADVGHLH